ncbi:MAG: superoxide dismutase [Proteobacteria bacterium]|nr:superoxide dismutase [Pseudomonadota bacterium]
MIKLPNLPFAPEALELSMSTATLRTHHDKHHAAYVKKVNGFMAERQGEKPTTLEAIVRLAAKEGDKKLFNNAAQAWNHGFFWQSLTADAGQGPTGALARAIEAKFRSLDAFAEQFATQGEGHFGSGWLWLVAEADGAIALKDTHDAATPISDGQTTPLLTCDLWEHAYYLDYKNERRRFLEIFYTKLANWRFAEAQYDAVHANARTWAYPQ